MNSLETGGELKEPPHRADRKQVIPVVLRAKDDGDFRKSNPITLHSNIPKAAGEIPSHL